MIYNNFKVTIMKRKEEIQVYSEEILAACRKGKPCDYGICDECPNIVGNTDNEEDE